MIPSREELVAFVEAGSAAVSPDAAKWCRGVLEDAFAQAEHLSRLKSELADALFPRRDR